jgi:hypothetical protein
MTPIFQTQEFRRMVLHNAAAKGELDQVYYTVLMLLPTRLRRKVGTGRMYAMHPVGFVPVVCAAPDPDAALETAELLRRLLMLANKETGVEFQLWLSAIDTLPENWYEWWDEWAGNEPTHMVDRICPDCATINRVSYGAVWHCDACGLQMRGNTVFPGKENVSYTVVASDSGIVYA